MIIISVPLIETNGIESDGLAELERMTLKVFLSEPCMWCSSKVGPATVNSNQLLMVIEVAICETMVGLFWLHIVPVTNILIISRGSLAGENTEMCWE